MDLIPIAEPARIKTNPRDDPSAETGMAGALAAFLSVLGDASGATPRPDRGPQLKEVRETAAGASGVQIPLPGASARPVPDAGDASAATLGAAAAAVLAEPGRPPVENTGADAAAIDMAATPPATRAATTEAPQPTFIDKTATSPEGLIQIPLTNATRSAIREAGVEVAAVPKPDWTIPPDRHGTGALPVATAPGEPSGDRPRPPESAAPQAANPMAPGHDAARADRTQAAAPRNRGVSGKAALTPAPAEMAGGSTADNGDPAPPGQRPVVVPASSAAPDSAAATHRPFVTRETSGDGPHNRQDLTVIQQARQETARATAVPPGMTPPQIPTPGAGGATDAPNLGATVVSAEESAQLAEATAPETRSASATQEPTQFKDTALVGGGETNEVPIDSGDPVASPADGPSPLRGLDRAAANHPATGPLPAGLGHRLAEAVSHFPDRPVEITLSPEELGRVRLTLATHDGALTMMVQADRPDTLDLLRRNIDSLAQDFRDLGYQDLTFSFGQERDPRQPPAPDGLIAFSEPDPVQAATDKPADDRPRNSAAGGLDLRM
ncbi:MAG: hypothetical protein B7Z02_14980 [Rhodobacterales bacterium 32-67-9]|nr:MAG: hypothetical protein B7Z02_14980 [Rhodobacterales bacterium 32-67-9]